MAVTMATLTFNSISPPLYCQKNSELASNRRIPNGLSVVSSPNISSSSSRFFSRGKDVKIWRHVGSCLNSKWRTRALASTPVEEGVEDAKRVIDEVLKSRAGDGGFAEASWALYADEETKKLLEDAVTKLSACRGQDFGQFLRSVDGHGVWEVFYAPHISRLSTTFGTQVKPLQYILTDSGFSSHVRYFSPFGQGWLSAAGDYVVKDGRTVEILFDSFWVDTGRDGLQPDPKGKGRIERTLVNLAGKGAFIPALSVYPVYYADADVTVFEFTTLRTRIAARKIRLAPFQPS